jgi:hypothetical protein
MQAEGIAPGHKLNVSIVGYDENGNGYALKEGVRISVPESRINDILDVEILSCSSSSSGQGRATAKISSIIRRRKVGGNDPIFNDEEMDQIERSIPRERYRYSERLKAYYTEQRITVPGIAGKERLLFVRLDLESKDYDVQMTNIFDVPAEELILMFYSAMKG